MKDPDCEECRRLWQAYLRATNEHFRLDGKLDSAKLSHDEVAIEYFLSAAVQADWDRCQLQSEIKAHNACAHALPADNPPRTIR